MINVALTAFASGVIWTLAALELWRHVRWSQ